MGHGRPKRYGGDKKCAQGFRIEGACPLRKIGAPTDVITR